MNKALRKRHSNAGSGRKSLRFSCVAKGWNRLLEIKNRIFAEPNLPGSLQQSSSTWQPFTRSSRGRGSHRGAHTIGCAGKCLTRA